MLAAPLLAGNDLRSMTARDPRRSCMNKEVIAVNQDKLGKVATRVSEDGETEVWARCCRRRLGHRAVQPRRCAAKVTAKWSDVQGQEER